MLARPAMGRRGRSLVFVVCGRGPALARRAVTELAQTLTEPAPATTSRSSVRR